MRRRFPSVGIMLGLVVLVTVAGGHQGMVSAAETVGSLSVESVPAGATVYVDGRFVGQTPVTVPNLPTGDHRVRLVKADYLQHRRVVNVGGGKTCALQVRLTTRAAQNASPQAAGLKLVVIEGEDAVNIIQQKTAVVPVVEVRDRNDQPVAGAVVRFAIQGGRASFNGARTLSVTTNIAGRAAASGLTPASSGAFQITASAAFQGQTAVTTIAQTNVLTAAQAASVAGASGAGGTGGGAGGAAGGGAGGGGLSATTIGIVGGAVAGGTLVTLKAVGGNEGVRYQGAFSIDAVTTIVNTRNGIIVGNCFWRMVIAGTITADLGGPADGTLRGDADVNWTESEVSRTCSTALGAQTDSWRQAISGPAASLQFNRVFTGPGGSGAGGTVTRAVTFTGALNGEAITGTVTLSFSFTGIAPNGDAVTQGYPPSSAPVTLQKQ